MANISVKLQADMEVGFGLINTVSPVNVSINISNQSSNETFHVTKLCVSLKRRFLFINWWHHDVMTSNANITVRPNSTLSQSIDGRKIQYDYGENTTFTVKVFGRNGQIFESDMSRIRTILENANSMLGR